MARPLAVARQKRHTFLFSILSALAVVMMLFSPGPSSVAAQADPTAAPDDAGTESTLGGGPGAEIPYAGVNPFGTNVFLHHEVEQWKVTKTLEMAQGAAIKWIKQDFPWSDIEIHGKGDFEDRRDPNNPKSAWDKYDFIMDEAERMGLTVVGRVTFAPNWARAENSGANDVPTRYEDLADFIVALLDHYDGRLNYVQVWNEPNLAYEWIAGGRVDPAGYVELLKTVYTKVKEKHPDVAVMSAPMAINLETIDYAGNLNELDYWDQMYKAGAADYFDILSANAYGLDLPPSDPPSRDKLNFRRVELLREVMVSNGDSEKAVWFNEYGWNASPTTLSQEQQLRWRRVEPEVQAQWTVEGIQWALDNWDWSGVFFIWYLRQVGDKSPDNAEYYFQLVDPDFNPQPVYRAVKDFALRYAAQTVGTPTPAAPAETPTTGATPAAPTATGEPIPATSTTAPAPGEATVTTAPAAPTATAVPAPPTSGGDNTIWFIVGGVMIVLGLSVAGFLFTRRKI